MTSEPVLVDKFMLDRVLQPPGTQGAAAVENAVREGRAALTGVVLAKLSQGVKNEVELSRLRTALGLRVCFVRSR